MPNVVTPLKVLSLKNVTSCRVITCGVPGVRIGPTLASEWIRSAPIRRARAGSSSCSHELAAPALTVLAGKCPDLCPRAPAVGSERLGRRSAWWRP